MSEVLKFLECGYCKDIILLTQKVKACQCGACVGSQIGNGLYAYSGKRSTTFQLDRDSLKEPKGTKFIGVITEHGVLTAPDTHHPSGIIVVKSRPHIEIG